MPYENIKNLAENSTDLLVKKSELALKAIEDLSSDTKNFDFNRIERPFSQVFKLKKDKEVSQRISNIFYKVFEEKNKKLSRYC